MTSSSRSSPPTRTGRASASPPGTSSSPSSTAPSPTTTAVSCSSARTATCMRSSATVAVAAIPFESGQNRNTLLGKTLRINPDLNGSYSNPASNPYTGVDAGPRRDLVDRAAQPVACQLRPGDRWALDRRCRAGQPRGDQPRVRRPRRRAGTTDGTAARARCPSSRRGAQGRSPARWPSTAIAGATARSPAATCTAGTSSTISRAATSSATSAADGSGPCVPQPPHRRSSCTATPRQ